MSIKGIIVLNSLSNNSKEEMVRNKAIEISNSFIKYISRFVDIVKDGNYLSKDVDLDQTSTLIYELILGMRVDSEFCKDDFKKGIYKLMTLKPSFAK